MCKTCRQTFLSTANVKTLSDHSVNKVSLYKLHFFLFFMNDSYFFILFVLYQYSHHAFIFFILFSFFLFFSLSFPFPSIQNQLENALTDFRFLQYYSFYIHWIPFKLSCRFENCIIIISPYNYYYI